MFFAAAGNELPYVGGVAGLIGAVVIAGYVARFQFRYVRPLEGRLERCEREHRHDQWQISFLVSVLRRKGIGTPPRFDTDQWEKEPPVVLAEDEPHL